MKTRRIREGDRVKVVRVEAEEEVVREHMSCFLGKIGTVATDPAWLSYEPEKGPASRIITKGECEVQFDSPCARHGDRWGVFPTSALEKVTEEE